MRATLLRKRRLRKARAGSLPRKFAMATAAPAARMCYANQRGESAMTERPFTPLTPQSLDRLMQDLTGDSPMQRRIRHFAAVVERNKTRRRRNDDPPAAVPVPAVPRRGGPFLQGGAAAALVFENA